MPTRQVLQSPPLTLPISPPSLPTPSTTESHPNHHHRHHNVLPPVAGATSGLCSLILLLLLLCRKIHRSRTAPADSKPPHRFSYSTLRRSTAAFSASRRLGQGGSGSVFRGHLPSSGKPIAVKLIDSGSLQGEREFRNELLFAGKLDSDHVAPVLGFCTKRHRMILVYEYFVNGSLQDALLHHKREDLKDWNKRFRVCVDVAKGLAYLHACDPPIIHSDIKPSNVLLDESFRAKIADFGLARVKETDSVAVAVEEVKVNGGGGGGAAEDCGSVVEETESVVTMTTTTGFEEFSVGGVDRSPESFVKITGLEASPEAAEVAVVAATASPETNVAENSESFDGVSVESGKEMKRNRKVKRSVSGRDWWWRQNNGAEIAAENGGVVKDYVMEWIGSEIDKERPNTNWIVPSTSSSGAKEKEKSSKKRNRKRLDWWVSLDDNEKSTKKEKRRPAREWWREEYCEELERKKKKKKKKTGASDENGNGVDDWWPRDDELYVERKKKHRSRSRSSRGSIDWWLDGLSGELWRGRGNSHDSGEIPKSGGISSTPSMRGTVCYIAPEYGGGSDVSEKCDVYSYGVLLLVIIAGRRPLQVSGSPMSEFQRANLISWARHLARAGKVVDLVDKSIHSLDQEQAVLGIKVALLCLQKSPACRPSMNEVVAMLSGEMDVPQLPYDFSPSPQSRFPFKSQKKAR